MSRMMFNAKHSRTKSIKGIITVNTNASQSKQAEEIGAPTDLL